ncbi:unnamed protein product [Candida verbasci]|uniref:Uncharacterized protein n=1 Tax=Candida verbasci TaxID=1227364 RepID=A0A9W4TS57_9ASCO|nr:unnamed protein product [Candida verbasci]
MTSSASRLRKLDKSIIEQSNLLDEDDQTEYINQLNTYNQTTYITYINYLSYLYILEIVLILLLVITASKLINILLLLSVTLSYILLKLKTDYDRIVQNVNYVMVLQLGILGVARHEFLYLVLPVFNITAPWVYKYWNNDFADQVDQLNRLKYKYKNV